MQSMTPKTNNDEVTEAMDARAMDRFRIIPLKASFILCTRLLNIGIIPPLYVAEYSAFL